MERFYTDIRFMNSIRGFDEVIKGALLSYFYILC